MLPKKHCRAINDWPAEVGQHKPILEEYADPPIPFQWWRGELYLAGFPNRDSAMRYGRMMRWG